MPYICRENLEKEVDEAIKKGRFINFDKRPKEECRYIQKVAEDKLSRHGVYVNIIIFSAAVGISILLTTPTGIINNIVKDVVFIIIFIPAYFKFRQWRQTYDRCSKIVLDAEERLINLETINGVIVVNEDKVMQDKLEYLLDELDKAGKLTMWTAPQKVDR